MQNQPYVTKRESLGTDYTGGEQGVRLGPSTADPKVWGYRATNESGAEIFSLLGGTTIGTRWLAGSYGASPSPNAQLFENGVMIAAGNATAAPTAKPGTQPLMLGGTPTALSQRVSEVIVYKRVLTAADITQLKLYFAPQFPQ
jgi:hypothetical protein